MDEGSGISGQIESSEQIDEYYVQYEVSASQHFIFSVRDIGNNLRVGVFPLIYGPVKKGYFAHIEWTGDGHGGKASAIISVSKNGSPFVTKKYSTESSYSGSLSYTIE